MISLLFALDHEAALVRRSLQNADSFRFSELTCVVGAYERQEISLGILGMGAQAAGEQTAVFLKYFRPRLIILAGYAGALVPGLSKGEVVLAGNYARLSSSLLPTGLSSRQLASASEVVSSRKGREALRTRTQAEMVDMETASVALEVSRHQIPFLPIRAISDGLEDDLPSQALAAAYDVSRQTTTPMRLLRHLLFQPRDLGPFASFVSGLTEVRSRLTQVVLETVRLNSAKAS